MAGEIPPQSKGSPEGKQRPRSTKPSSVVQVPLAGVLSEIVRRIKSPVILAAIAFPIIVVVALVLAPDIMDKLPALPYVMLAYGTIVVLIVVVSAYVEARGRAEKHAPPAPRPPDPQPRTPPESGPSAPGDPERRYLRWVHDKRALVALAGIDRQAGDVTRQGMTLQAVYTKMDTRQHALAGERYRGAAALRPSEREQMARERETRPLPALEAISVEQRAVLLGGPGSGKSTLVNYLTLCLSGYLLNAHADWLTHLQPEWDGGSPLPVPVILRDFAAWLPAGTQRGRADLVARYLHHLLKEADAIAYADDLMKTIERGRVFLLFDGLDEVPAEQRGVVRDAVRAFADGCNCRTVVTCRTLSYSDEEWQLPGWPVYELAVFSRQQIEAFIASWYDEVVRLGRKTRAEADDLVSRIGQTLDSQWDEFQPLAEIPLLMTLMAIVHTDEGKLPDSRVLLYDRCVELLLWRWEKGKRARQEGQPEELGLLRDLNQPGVDRTALEKTIWCIAYDAHAEQGAHPGVADIPANKLTATLNAYLGLNEQQVRTFLNYCQERSGLLLYSGARQPEGALKPVAIYTFPHRTFQEYLAARHLASRGNFPSAAVEHACQGDHWREVILLGVEWKRQQGDTDYALDVARALYPAERPARDDRAGWRCAWLAGEAILAVGAVVDPHRRKEAIELRTRITRRIADLLEVGALDVRERIAAGEALARLGDPRFSGPYLLPEFVSIPAGEFWMGSDQISDDERPVHRVRVEAFAISRYPVTNAQYAVFVQATGQKPPRHWEGGQVPPHLANHPVVNVTWDGAVAYCRWLSQETGQAYRLPSEAEWERAARGAADQREWPWGDGWDAEKCNTVEGGPGTITPAGIYSAGASPEGVLDMAGNVWEWCSSLYKPYPYDPGDGRENPKAKGSRVLRGGSWNGSRNGARCACRNGYDAGNWNHFVGFRCARGSP